MPKRYTRKKRTYRRRKVVRRRRRGAPRVRPDGMHKEKVTIAKEFKTNGTTSAFMAFHWLSQYQVPQFADYNATYAGDNRQHFAISGIYKFFRVYGMQIKYIPYVYGQSGANPKAVREAYFGSIADDGQAGVPASEQAIRNKPDYMPLDPTRHFKRYIRVGKWLGKQKIGWKQTPDTTVPPANWPEPYEDNEKFQSQLIVKGENLG